MLRGLSVVALFLFPLFLLPSTERRMGRRKNQRHETKDDNGLSIYNIYTNKRGARETGERRNRPRDRSMPDPDGVA